MPACHRPPHPVMLDYARIAQLAIASILSSTYAARLTPTARFVIRRAHSEFMAFGRMAQVSDCDWRWIDEAVAVMRAALEVDQAAGVVDPATWAAVRVIPRPATAGRTRDAPPQPFHPADLRVAERPLRSRLGADRRARARRLSPRPLYLGLGAAAVIVIHPPARPSLRSALTPLAAAKPIPTAPIRDAVLRWGRHVHDHAPGHRLALILGACGGVGLSLLRAYLGAAA